MNSRPDELVDVAGQLALAGLLAPLSVAAPCGPAARYDPLFTEVRLLREEDDPSLPMGQWERPLKRADWPRIERCCADMLATRSKDLQIAMWLLEAWMRQYGYAGLEQGLRLLDGLLRHYWQPLHPVIDDDGDCDARLAPLEWLNESVSASLRLHAALLVLDGDKSTAITLADWERLTAQDRLADDAAGRKTAAANQKPQAPELTRSAVHTAASQMPGALATTVAAVERSLAALRSVSALLHQHLQAESPNLGKLQHVLEAARRVLLQWQPEEKATQMNDEQGAETPRHAGQGLVLQPVAAPGRWSSRDEAYATLAALADYLSLAEPHSPTPFLLRRAVSWGRMSLPEVIAEIIREEGDVTRLLQVLGIRA